MHSLLMVDLGGVWGGQEIYSASIMAHLRNAGWEVTSFSGQEKHRRFASEFVPVSISYAHFWKAARTVNSLQDRHDIVHFNGIRAIYLSRICKKIKPFIGTKHSRQPLLGWTNPRAILARVGSLLAFDKLDWLITVSNTVRGELPAHVRRRSNTIMSGVANVSYGHPRLPERALVTVCYVGRLDPDKDIMRLLDAVRILKGNGCEFRVLLAGSGPLEDEARSYAETHNLDNVRFLGYVEKPGSVYCQSHICVLPSVYEGLPLSMLEALSAGCALVGHPVPGVADVIIDGHNGLFAPVSSQDLAEKLKKLIIDRDLLDAIRRRSRRDYEEKWRVERMVAETAELYSRLISTVLSRS